MRQSDSLYRREACIPASCDEGRHGADARDLPQGARGWWQLRRRHPVWSGANPDEPRVPLSVRAQSRAPGVTEAQVRRMIADPRADAFMNAFTGQWLQLRNLDKMTPDILMFPDFDDNVRQAFRKETELFFQSIVRENRSALDLLQADYTFVNERLARHYGIPNVYGTQFRRVPVTDDARRGLLGHGSILALTSYNNR